MRRNRTDLIVIHCAATPPDMDIGVKEIRQWHEAKGWSDVGYHYVIRRNGSIETGRDKMDVGAHALGFNANSIAICLVGGEHPVSAEADCNFTSAQWMELHMLVGVLKSEFLHAKVIGHRDLTGVTKACPCFDVGAWWGKS
jgi:N-acetylmuramoyl-L-alanine amidase